MAAALIIVPAFVLLSVFAEGGSQWWLLAAIAYPVVSLALILFLVGPGMTMRRAEKRA
jgi:hypothetical protein